MLFTVAIITATVIAATVQSINYGKAKSARDQERNFEAFVAEVQSQRRREVAQEIIDGKYSF